MGMGISDGAKRVATLGEGKIHMFDSDEWITIERTEEMSSVAAEAQHE